MDSDGYASASVCKQWDKQIQAEDEETFCFQADQPQDDPSDETTKKNSQSPYSNMTPEKCLEKLMYEAGITDNQLAKFHIKVKVGSYEKEETKNIKNGLQICFKNKEEDWVNTKKVYAEHEPRVYEELFSRCEEVFTCDYKDSVKKDKLAGMLDKTGGGIVLKYSEKSLQIYRLCQIRVFVEGDKVIRSTKYDIPEKKVFSYTTFVEQLQKKTKTLKPIVITLGKSDDTKLSVEIIPFAQKILSEYYHSNNSDVEDITANLRNLATMIMPL